MELRSRSCDWLLGMSIFLTNSLLFLLLLFQKACFVDFQKAYDTIWRNGLFYKLMKYGFSQKIIFLLKSMYDRVVSAVKVKSGLTATFTPLVGVRQGCKLIVNDIVDIFDSTCDPLIMGECKISYLLYADGLILLSESEHGLKRCLDKLNCYAKKWQMRINIKKTKAIIFNKSGKIFRSEFKLGNQPIQVTDSYVYLGITFTPSGSFSLAQKKLYYKATRSLYGFLSEVNIYNGASVSAVLKLFDSLVSPMLLYNCEIWDCFLKSVGNNYEKFVSRIFDERITPENMQNKICKMALGVHSKASNHAVKGELGRFPLHLIIYTRIFKYFLRLFTLQNNQILKSTLEIKKSI